MMGRVRADGEGKAPTAFFRAPSSIISVSCACNKSPRRRGRAWASWWGVSAQEIFGHVYPLAPSFRFGGTCDIFGLWSMGFLDYVRLRKTPFKAFNPN